VSTSFTERHKPNGIVATMDRTRTDFGRPDKFERFGSVECCGRKECVEKAQRYLRSSTGMSGRYQSDSDYDEHRAREAQWTKNVNQIFPTPDRVYEWVEEKRKERSREVLAEKLRIAKLRHRGSILVPIQIAEEWLR
jgi:hypothetical protein